jgi:hypothetical protein
VSTLSTLPQVVDIDHYAGDTLVIHITITDEVIGGRVFTAQVRQTRNAPRPDATFVVILNPGVGADIMLTSADCLALTKRGDYEGFWDVQLAMADGGDPVTTLAQGEMRLHTDVTRAVST